MLEVIWEGLLWSFIKSHLYSFLHHSRAEFP